MKDCEQQPLGKSVGAADAVGAPVVGVAVGAGEMVGWGFSMVTRGTETL